MRLRVMYRKNQTLSWCRLRSMVISRLHSRVTQDRVERLRGIDNITLAPEASRNSRILHAVQKIPYRGGFEIGSFSLGPPAQYDH